MLKKSKILEAFNNYVDNASEMEADNIGMCVDCGALRDGCEPDADGYECEACGAQAVKGCLNVLLDY